MSSCSFMKNTLFESISCMLPFFSNIARALGSENLPTIPTFEYTT